MSLEEHNGVSVATLGDMCRHRCTRCEAIATLIRDDTDRIVISDLSRCPGRNTRDEPVFVLRASDPIAPMAIRLWAAQSWQQGGDPEKIAKARAIAEAMEKWHMEHRT